MAIIKHCAFALLFLITSSMELHGQDFKILIPDPEISGVTTVNIADLNNDWLPDIAGFEGGKHAQGRQLFAWYAAPDWTRHEFDPDFKPGPFTGDSEFADVDNDGDLDLILPEDKHSGNLELPANLYWFENPFIPTGNAATVWKKHAIDTDIADGFHLGDVEVAFLDGDDKIDVVVRHLGNNNELLLYFQNTPDDWHIVKLPNQPRREGLVLLDLDQDNIPDMVMNGYVLFANNPRNGDYQQVIFDKSWIGKEGNLSNSTKNVFADLNGDGKKDLLVTPAEGAEVYLAWYDLPENPRTESWTKHIIEDSLTANHQALASDFDMDGDTDVFVGLSFGKKGTYLWLNDGDGTSWTKKIIDPEYGMYYGVTGDLGNDGDMDIVGPNTYSKESKILIIENNASPGARK